MYSDRSDWLKPAGFPHSEIQGSRVVCTSPWLIAAYHVLHRLHAPRHPPCALSSLTIKFAHRKLDQHIVSLTPSSSPVLCIVFGLPKPPRRHFYIGNFAYSIIKEHSKTTIVVKLVNLPSVRLEATRTTQPGPHGSGGGEGT